MLVYDKRYGPVVCLYVHPSVCHKPVLYQRNWLNVWSRKQRRH